MHDAKGRELKQDDIVLIPAKIKDVYPTEDYCNVNLVSIFSRRPDGAKENISAINTGVLLRSNEGDENDLSEFISNKGESI